MIRYLRQKFRGQCTDDAGKPIPRDWIGDQDEAVFVDIGSGKVHAYVSRDGRSKYYSTVYVSPLLAFRLCRNHPAVLVSLLPLPRCMVELARLTSMEDAKGVAELALEGGS